MSALDRVREQYPMLAFLLDDPEVGPLLRDASDTTPMSPSKFSAEFMSTNWYRSRSAAARQYEIMRNTDPGEFETKIGDYTTAVQTEADRLGVDLTSNEVKWLAHSALRNGQSTSDPRIAQGIARIRRRTGTSRVQYGAIRSAARNTRSVAHNDYYTSVSDNEMWKWGEQIAQGKRTEQDLRTFLSNRAESKYPHLRNQLRAGNTMNDIFGGHVQAIAETLEISPTEVTPWSSNSRWKPITGVVDPNTNETRAMTLSEAERFARTDPAYWRTQQGRSADAGMAQTLLQTFGEQA